jgi:hypothetical protein
MPATPASPRVLSAITLKSSSSSRAAALQERAAATVVGDVRDEHDQMIGPA